ncbi:MAG: hypothetical protein QMD71_02375 [bacterium]|nr:hypothetical protein [bacterium]
MIGQVGISPFERFTFGISYGGEKVIGTGTPNWHKSPGVQAKVGITAPRVSFAVGFDSEPYDDSSKGIYGVFGGDLGGKFIPYFGVNYYKWLEAFYGVETGLSKEAKLLLEGYVKHDSFILNTGIRWAFEDRITLELSFKNLLGDEVIRVLKFSYTDYI